MRKIEQDGLVWGASKLAPVGYGISKLQINLVVEDEKVSLDDLQQKIEEDEDHVQSTDIVSSSPSGIDFTALANMTIYRPLCRNYKTSLKICSYEQRH